MEEDGEDLTPFWLQSSADRRRGRRVSSLILNSGVFVFLLCVTAVLFIFFVVPSVVSFTAQVFRPSSVKKSWDSLNIVLVVFALVFGFLSRNKNYDYDSGFDGDRRNVTDTGNEDRKSPPSTPYQWYEYSDRTVYSSSAGVVLRRTFSSYPDLREASPWVAADDSWRFSDDTQVDSYWVSDSDRFRRRPSWKRVQEEGGSDQTKTIHVDTLVNRAKDVSYSSPPLPSPPAVAVESLRKPKRTYASAQTGQRIEQESNESEPTISPASPSLPSLPPPQQPLSSSTPPQPLRAEAGHRKPKRTYESIAQTGKRKAENKSEHAMYLISPPVVTAPPPPSPPPLPLPSITYSEKSDSKSDGKRGGSSANKDFLTSLYHQKKRKKKQRQKSVDNFETLVQPQAPTSPPLSQPPPPPPPPPPSVFHLFSSKKGKSKKIISVPPPPPPPPPPNASHASRTTLQTAPIAAQAAPLPVKISSFSSVEENSNSGGESPLIPIPPPPPPFKMPSWKFVVQGDYVRIGSMNSSRSGSPDLDDADSPRSEISTESSGPTAAVEGGEIAEPLFCPSPDVNTKADMFIAKFKAGLKLQKNNSLKQKQGLRLSNLGPETKTGPGPSQI